MIPELITIEHYLGRLEAVMPLEDIVSAYGCDSVRRALAEDDLELRFTFCRIYARLTDKARCGCYHASVPGI